MLRGRHRTSLPSCGVQRVAAQLGVFQGFTCTLAEQKLDAWTNTSFQSTGASDFHLHQRQMQAGLLWRPPSGSATCSSHKLQNTRQQLATDSVLTDTCPLALSSCTMRRPSGVFMMTLPSFSMTTCTAESGLASTELCLHTRSPCRFGQARRSDRQLQ